MKEHRRYPAAALLAAFLLFASCVHHKPPTADQAQRKTDSLESYIRDTVKDPARADRLVLLSRQADEQAKELTQVEKQYREQMKELNANYDAAREEFDALDARYTAELSRYRERIIDALFAMRSAATEDEWKKIEKREAKALSTRLRSGG